MSYDYKRTKGMVSVGGVGKPSGGGGYKSKPPRSRKKSKTPTQSEVEKAKGRLKEREYLRAKIKYKQSTKKIDKAIKDRYPLTPGRKRLRQTRRKVKEKRPFKVEGLTKTQKNWRKRKYNEVVDRIAKNKSRKMRLETQAKRLRMREKIEESLSTPWSAKDTAKKALIYGAGGGGAAAALYEIKKAKDKKKSRKKK